MQGNAKQRYSKNTWWCNDRTMLSIASAVQPEWLSKDCWVSYHSKCKFHWCVITERFWWWQFENKRTSTIYKSSFMSTSWSEEYRSLVRHCDEVLFCGGFLNSWSCGCLLYTVMDCSWILCLHPHISGDEITTLNSHFLNLKAHTQCCSHCLNFCKEHVTMATVLHWQNIVLIWDTHKGESDLNTRQFRISNCETDIPAW